MSSRDPEDDEFVSEYGDSEVGTVSTGPPPPPPPPEDDYGESQGADDEAEGGLDGESGEGADGMSNVEVELWNVFTYYALHGNPLDPEHMTAFQFVKFCRDSGILGPETPVKKADVNVSFTHQVKRPQKYSNLAGRTCLLNYEAFLNALLELSLKAYPKSTSTDECLHKLLLEFVLPLASRRSPDSIDDILEDPEVQQLYRKFEHPIYEIFEFYASAADVNRRKQVASGRAKGGKEDTSQSAIVKRDRSINSMKGFWDTRSF